MPLHATCQCLRVAAYIYYLHPVSPRRLGLCFVVCTTSFWATKFCRPAYKRLGETDLHRIPTCHIPSPPAVPAIPAIPAVLSHTAKTTQHLDWVCPARAPDDSTHDDFNVHTYGGGKGETTQHTYYKEKQHSIHTTRCVMSGIVVGKERQYSKNHTAFRLGLSGKSA